MSALRLYHDAPTGASLRVLVTAFEKGLADIATAGAAPPPGAEDAAFDLPDRPAIAVNGAVLRGAGFLCEYLEEAVPVPALLPADPDARWEARAWGKLVDDGFGASMLDLARAALNGDAIEPARLTAARERAQALVTRAEARLQGDTWLAGDGPTLADIAVFAYAGFLPHVAPDLLDAAPAVAAWLDRTLARPAVQAALAIGGAPPFATVAGDDRYIRWG